MRSIQLRGARTHNLKGLDLDLHAGELLVVVGPSGAGKSSLASATLYAEGQRRFVESFSPYARQFLERLARPPMTSLDPIAAAVAVDRKTQVKSSRSTLATLTGLEPFLAGLYAKESVPTCPTCGDTAHRTSAEGLAARVQQLAAKLGGAIVVSYPVQVASEEAYLTLRETWLGAGFQRVLALRDGAPVLATLDELRPSEVAGREVHVVVDRMLTRDAVGPRTVEAVETAARHAEGRVHVYHAQDARAAWTEVMRGQLGLSCPSCARTFSEPTPGLFSFNSPLGACPSCKGFGRVIGVNWHKVIPDGRKSLAAGAIRAWAGKSAEWERGALKKFALQRGIPLDVPWDDLTEQQREAVLEGDGAYGGTKFPGVRGFFRWLEGRVYKMHVRVFLARYREYVECTDCRGGRLGPRALAYQVDGVSLPALSAMTVAEVRARVARIRPHDAQGRYVLAELDTRLGYLEDVGLGYLALDRQARTLSGGETQRAALTNALGTALTSTLFVIDEPTTGLHPAEAPTLAAAMQKVRDRGNAIVVVDHEPAVLARADRVLELGPGAGEQGGTVVYDGPRAHWSGTATAAALTKSLEVARRGARPSARHVAGTLTLTLSGPARTWRNLKVDAVDIPLGGVTAICGPSGSGKSTLVDELLFPAVQRALDLVPEQLPPPGTDVRFVGAAISKVVLVDQDALGRTARGNAATYSQAWQRLRAVFAASPEARALGLTAAHFSFNVASSDGRGRCEACAGEGFETVEMSFLADVHFECPSCLGRRFGREVLSVRVAGKNVADVLDMTVSQVLAHFDPADARDYVLGRALQPLVDVGLGYLRLGQPLSTLSGGETQRLKLARALAEVEAGTLLLLDEPSAGLHPGEIGVLSRCFSDLCARGVTILIVEHELALVADADWVIELGPGGGPAGGRVVFNGSATELARADTLTGRALREEQARRASAAALAKRQGVPAALTLAAPARTALEVRGARENNLRDVSVRVPRNALTIVTGPSGSGKSSLAFDVIAAEGQRRFMDTLSPYARQFLPMLPRPAVDEVTDIEPTIALEQRTTRPGPNSTVATVTEVGHFLRLMFAKLGDVDCPACGAPTAAQSREDVLATLQKQRKLVLLAPVVQARKGTHLDVFTQASRAGVQQAMVDGARVTIDPPPKLTKSKEHTIELVVFEGEGRTLTLEQLEAALAFSRGSVKWGKDATACEQWASPSRACTRCGEGVPDLDPRFFSFNTKQGQCETCLGAGVLSSDVDGTLPCPDCEGSRLSPLARGVRLFGAGYATLTALSVAELRARLAKVTLNGRAAKIGDAPLGELLRRLAFIDDMGLGYLSLSRAAATLSGGEMQRLRLAAQLGSGLTGVLYVLDEPTIGLHPSDTHRLLGALRRLIAMGGSVLLVEHDAEMIRAADHVIDLGPGGGRDGGRVVVAGPASEVLGGDAPTARALRETAALRTPVRVSGKDPHIELCRARLFNLRDVNLSVPVGRMTVVAGVSGAGKSTLVRSVFLPALRRAVGLVAETPGPHEKLVGYESIRRALAVDQSPIGRTPRSVPATFLGIWDDVRKLFASLPEARVRGYGPARFSFNGKRAASTEGGEARARGKRASAKGAPQGSGRCERCEGQGVIVSEMSFLPEVSQPCDACLGLRFDAATLEVTYRDRNIGEVLQMTVSEAVEYFAVLPKVRRPLETLQALGLGYLAIGQGSHTLSGGEAQRLKLAAELTATVKHEPTVYVLDEPTTGLHLSDVRRLVAMLDKLVQRGDTVVVIEHHPDVIRSADWVVELGEGGGPRGGKVVFAGTPAALVRAKTATAAALAVPK